MAKPRNHSKKHIRKGRAHADGAALEKYIISDERDLPMRHTGADISRPLNAMRLAEYRKCKDCITLPILYIQYKTEKGDKRQVGLCNRHWERLADTVIGWKGD